MRQPRPTAIRSAHPAPDGAAHPWADRPSPAGLEVAVLLTDVEGVTAAVRAYRTVLPRAQLWYFGGDPARRAEAEAAGAAVRDAPDAGRDALVRRMLAEAEADVYVLAHRAGADDACVAPLLLAEVEAGRDLVDVRRMGAGPPRDAGERLLGRAVDFLYGGRGDALQSDFKACSRRFALSYRRTAPRAGEPSARALALHALRLRLPFGQVAALAPHPAREPAPPRGAAGWAALLGLLARLAIEERPRRTCGVAGFTVAAVGLAAGAPAPSLGAWQALSGPRPLAALSLALVGIAVAAAGLPLDALASARQEVRRLGAAAIPRRIDRGADQSSVS